MSEEIDLDAANDLRKATHRLVVKGQRRAALDGVNAYLKILDDNRVDSSIDCEAGCAYCCSLPVMITVAEAELVAEAIERSPRKEELVSRIRESFETIKGKTLQELELTRVPCPLLDGESGRGLCAVYEARPLACRTYTSDDVEICRRVYRDTAAEVASPSRPEDYMTHLMLSSGLAGPMQKAFELRALLLELLTKTKRARLKPATLDTTLKLEGVR